mgnify:FL=1
MTLIVEILDDFVLFGANVCEREYLMIEGIEVELMGDVEAIFMLFDVLVE